MTPSKRKSKRKTSKTETRKSQAQIRQFNWMWLAAGLALIIVIVIEAVLIFPKTDQAPGLAKAISVDEAHAMYQAGAFFLDVRENEEWIDYHIPDTTLVPLGELESRLDELPHDQDIVVVCRSGNRSQAGRDILLNAGFSQVTSMSGGLKQWSTSGYPTVSGP